MQENFARAMAIELVFEGGKVDLKSDPGGRTNQGITQRTFDAYLLNNKLPSADVFNMTVDERNAIYRLQYADKIKFDGLPAGADVLLLDGAVNSGVGQTVKWAQRSLPGYTGKIDGVMGEATFAAIVACADLDAFIVAYSGRRMTFLKALKTFSTFGKGWSSRVQQIEKIAREWATGNGQTDAQPFVNTGARATISDAKTFPSTAPGAAAAALGTTTGGATAAAQSWISGAKEKIASITFIPHMDVVSSYLDHASSLIATAGYFAGGAIAVCGGAWFWYANRRTAALHDALDTLPAASVTKPAGVPVAGTA